MRLLVLIVSLALAAGALADDKKPKPKSTIKQLDKSSPMLISGDDDTPGDEAAAADAKEKANRSKTRAQDYNSSRSNTTSLRGGPETDTTGPGMGRSSERNKGQQGDRASGGKRDAASGMSTGRRQHAPGRDLGNENRCSMGRLDCDDDGDSISTRDTCGNGIDNDCDSDVDAAPANHNTTRSNRTQPVSDDGGPVVRKKPGKH